MDIMITGNNHLKIHYHISWTETGKLDWEPFASMADAAMRATELAQRDENYEIEEFDETCPQCEKMRSIAGKDAPPLESM
jgi:hypothetical protein